MKYKTQPSDTGQKHHIVQKQPMSGDEGKTLCHLDITLDQSDVEYWDSQDEMAGVNKICGHCQNLLFQDNVDIQTYHDPDKIIEHPDDDTDNGEPEQDSGIIQSILSFFR